MQNAAGILDTYERLGWKNNDPMAQMLQLRRENPKALGELVILALGRPLKHTTFIDAALDLMDDDTYIATVGAAWERVQQGASSDLLSSILDSACLQYPLVYASDWEQLLSILHTGDSGPAYQDDLAWRALDARTVNDWLTRLEHDTGAGTLGRKRAIALLRSRRPDAVQRALSRLFPDPADAQAASWLQLAGYCAHADGLRMLHGAQPLHIRFSAEQRITMQADQPSWRRAVHQAHPTWQSDAPPLALAHMGGSITSTCGLCHQPLHRLLSLAQPALAGIASETALEFATCLSCQGWESDGPMFYRHDATGMPTAHPGQQRSDALTPDYAAEALLEADVQLFTAPARWTWQDWGESNGRQNLSRVGGPPSWVQSADYPACPDCQEDMVFTMQLDSNLPQDGGAEWLWGSGGCNYTFWCADCRVSGQLWQCT
ncbi:hypothetical protein RAS12_16020 [Achromobacter seleniivolatilans]|uniref:DUF1963 domain-containing protein n=1 Tax=Achromobacter seleniivolatilans TaxID=3047478 RepID=A0ABY9LUN8_9BURK|nr:hypothetical protein [Achromobacter sp. R39]WMD18160.1 hypothetical protein RAS12_16020 [Achromobacter sp. R39]